MEHLFLEDYEAGQQLQIGGYHVPKEEVIAFATHWDPQPFHIDEEAAEATFYGGLTACSAHIFAIFCRLSNRLEKRAAALAALGFDEFRIPNPLRVGDTVRLLSECTAVRRSKTKPDRGIINFSVRLLNQNDEVVFSIKSTVMVRSRASDAQEGVSGG